MTAPAKFLTTAMIQSTVARYYKIPLAKMTEADRHREFAWPRQMAMTLARDLISHPSFRDGERCPISLHALAGRFDRDHVTVFRGIRSTRSRILTNPETAHDYAELVQALTGEGL